MVSIVTKKRKKTTSRPRDDFGAQADTSTQNPGNDNIVSLPPLPEKPGQYYIGDNNAVYKRIHGKDDKLILAPISEASKIVGIKNPQIANDRDKRERLERWKLLIQMRDLKREILFLQEQYSDEAIEAATMNEPPWAERQRKLAGLYDDFIDAYGPINKEQDLSGGKRDEKGEQSSYTVLPNLRDFRRDPDAYFVASLETFDSSTGETKRDPVFTDRVVAAKGQIPVIETPEDALVFCLNEKGKLDIPYMAEILAKEGSEDDIDEEEIIRSLGRKQLIFLDPETEEWEIAETYLSGNIRRKLTAAKEAAITNRRFRANVSALREVRPIDLEPSDIDISLGMHWIPPHIIAQFAEEEFGAEDANITYIPKINMWIVDATHGLVSDSYFDYCAADLQPHELMEHCLNNEDVTAPRGYKSGEETQLARAKQDEMRERFKSWIWEDPERAAEVCSIYNEQFNSYVPIHPDGSHLSFPGMSTAITLRDYQANVAWRNLRKGNTLYAHAVGGGKTFASIAACMEMQRLGRVKKPCFIVPNHMLAQFSRDFYKLYPNANLLVLENDYFGEPGKQLNMAQKIEKFVRRAHDHEWDGIFMTQSSFDRLHVSPHAKLQMMLDELREYRDLIDQYSRSENDTAVEFLRKASEEKQKELICFVSPVDRKSIGFKAAEEAYYQKEWEENFRTLLGKDADHPAWKKHIQAVKTKEIAEAAAKQKPGTEETKKEQTENDHQSVYFEDTGIDYLFVDEGDEYKNKPVASEHQSLAKTGSAKAKSLQQKLHYLEQQNPGYSMSLMTATPISNSVSEVYVQQSYMQASVLKRLGIEHFDAWANLFAEVVKDLEMAPEGNEYRIKERIARYKNVAELKRLFHNFADVISVDMLNLPKPDIKEGKPTTIVVKQNPALDLFFKSLSKRANSARQHGNNWEQIAETLTGAELKRIDRYIEARRQARIEDAEDRIEAGTEEEVSIEDIILTIIMDGRLATLDPRLVGVEPDSDIPGKIETCAQEIFKRYDANKDREYLDENDEPSPIKGSLQVVFCDLGIPKPKTGKKSKFDVYRELKKQLEAEGIPRDKIAFIHDTTSDRQKAQLFERCRRGEVSVLIGTTKKLGAGTNVQDRLVAAHHLDPPWRPRDIIQRDGRIHRPGNQNPEIEILRYVVERSYDVFMWQTIERKARFIHQFMSRDLSKRDFDEGDDFVQECASVRALAANDPLIFQKIEIDYELDMLEKKRQAHRYETRKAKKHQIPKLKEEIEELNTQISEEEATLEKMDFDGPLLVLDGKTFRHAAAKAGEFLRARMRETKKELRAQLGKKKSAAIEKPFGSVNGLSITLEAKIEAKRKKIKDKKAGKTKTTNTYQYAFALKIDDAADTNISYSAHDIRETTEERKLKKRLAKPGTLSQKFKDIAQGIQKADHELTQRLVADYAALKTRLAENRQLLQEKEGEMSILEQRKNKPFEDQERYNELSARKRKIEAALLENPSERKNVKEGQTPSEPDMPSP